MTEKHRRQFLKLVSASLASALGMGVLSDVSSDAEAGITETGRRLLRRRSRQVVVTPTREKLIERLEKLAASEPPTDLKVSEGALCYAMEAEEEIRKPCPKCGRTMKVGEMEEFLREYNVPLKRIRDQGVNAKLILPEHCPKCGYGLQHCGMTWEERAELSDEQEDARAIQLEIKYPDHRDPVRAMVYPYDLEVLAVFLQGKDRMKHIDCETALKDEVETLREFLGIAEPSDE